MILIERLAVQYHYLPSETYRNCTYIYEGNKKLEFFYLGIYPLYLFMCFDLGSINEVKKLTPEFYNTHICLSS